MRKEVVASGERPGPSGPGRLAVHAESMGGSNQGTATTGEVQVITKADLRAAADLRAMARKASRDASATLRALVPHARHSGFTDSAIQRLTGVSRVTLAAWSDDPAPEQLRTITEADLRAVGRDGLREAERSATDNLRRLVVQAVRERWTLGEIATVTGLSKATVNDWRKAEGAVRGEGAE